MNRDEARTSLGAYVLGALDPTGRAALERWLADDAELREELADLAALPGLLGRLQPGDEQPADGEAERDEAFLERIVAAAAAERRTDRRRLWIWRAVAVAAAVAAIVVGTLAIVTRDQGGPQTAAPPPAAPAPAAPIEAISFTPVDDVALASGFNGNVRPDPRGWGTELVVQLWDLPDEPQFAMLVYAQDGRQEQAATWGPTTLRQCQVTGATSIPADQIARVEIVSTGGPVVGRANLT